MNSNKFNQAQEKLIAKANTLASTYLLTKYASAHLVGEPKLALTHTIDSDSSEIRFDGQITVFAESGLLNQVGINMTVNSNDIDVASEESIQSKIVEALNKEEEHSDIVVASLDGFKLKDRGDGYLLVSHSNLEDANLGILGQLEYDKSPNKQELLETIVTDSMARTASYNKIEFTGSFVEPVIEKKAAGCDQCDAAMINGVFCHEHGCPNQKRKNRFEDVMEEENIESSKKSWLTADLLTETNKKNVCETCELGDCETWGCSGHDEKTGVNCECPLHSEASLNTVSIKENMPKASSADHLAQASQLEEQMKNASNEKIKTQAVNALVSMLQSNGYGTAKVREVTASNTGFDVMVTVDADATLKAVNIPVEVKENNVILPKKSLVATLVASGLDLNARLSEEFGKQVLARIEAEEARIQYEQNEANAILAERSTVTKTAGDNGFNTPGYMAPQDSITLQKHLLPSDVEWEKGMVVYADNSYWKLSDMNFDQNSRGTEDSSEWHFIRCEAPKDDKDVTNIKI